MLSYSAILCLLLLVLQGQAATLCTSCESPKTLQWTPWFDRDNPTGNGDFETLSDLIKQGKKICTAPVRVDCQTTSGIPSFFTRQVVHISTSSGCYCINSEQPDRRCNFDYRVRFQCCQECPYGAVSFWTQFFDRDNPSATGDHEVLSQLIKERNPVCRNPLDVSCQTLAGAPATSTGEVLSISRTLGCRCLNNEQPDGVCNYDYKVRFKCCRAG